MHTDWCSWYTETNTTFSTFNRDAIEISSHDLSTELVDNFLKCAKKSHTSLYTLKGIYERWFKTLINYASYKKEVNSFIEAYNAAREQNTMDCYANLDIADPNLWE